jgi:hypothetical protein
VQHLGHVVPSDLDKPINYIGIAKYRRGKFRFTRQGNVSWDAFDASHYQRMVRGMHAYARKYLTTEALAAYILARANISTARKILYVLPFTDWDDFLQTGVLFGLRELGLDVTDCPFVDRLYRRPLGTSFRALMEEKEAVFGKLHGRGMTFGFRLPRVSVDRDVPTIHQRLREGYYDAVVYGAVQLRRWATPSGVNEAAVPFLVEARRAGYGKVSPGQQHEEGGARRRGPLLFIDGNDDHEDPHPLLVALARIGEVFQREMHDGVEC